MPCHILLVESAGPADAAVSDILSANKAFTVERRSLVSLSPDEIAKSEAAVVIGVSLSGAADAIPFLHRLCDLACEKIFIAILPAGGDAQLLEVVASLADDFVLWPARDGELEQRVRRFLNRQCSDPAAVAERLIDELKLDQLIGRHAAFLKVIEKIPIIAKSGAPVLITGETGTGKELSARAIHHVGPRRDFPFIAVDCGALPEHLVENELFGHARGAFTDAHSDQKGLISMANKGTLFLDEIDALTPSAQAKLLRFLQERTYRPLGSERFVQADIQVIAATNRDLESIVGSQHFRADLYYRLSVLRIQLPALRERRSDICLLARHFVANLTTGSSLHPKVLSPAALRNLEAYDWPGNVRELFNVIQQAVTFAITAQILPEDLNLPDLRPSAETEPANFRLARARTIEAFEKSFVKELLRKHSGNVTRAAFEAQKDRRTLGRMIKKYKIDRSALYG